MRYFAVLFLVLALPAWGTEKTFTWVLPTNWTDGAPLTAAQVTGYALTCNPGATVDQIPASAPNFKKDFGEGTYQCSLVLKAKKTPTSVELSSDPSGAVSFTVPPSRPNPVTLSVN